MSKHKSTDYKLTAVKYYLKGKNSLDDVCHIFNCFPKSLYRWVKRYKITKTLQRRNRKSISYKITKQHLQYAISLINKNEQITMKKLHSKVQKKYNTFNITSQHLGKVIRNNNITRENPKPYKKGNILVHGALVCKKCNAVWNRDVNGATNIFRIVKNIIDKKERPKYLCR